MGVWRCGDTVWRKCNVFQRGSSKEKFQTEAFALICNFHKLHIAQKFIQKLFSVNVFKIW